ncbi:MAG: hypothetical protein ACJA2S_001036 [Cyclobacteriaceae bacterium]|jgi:hypothetical protein
MILSQGQHHKNTNLVTKLNFIISLLYDQVDFRCNTY